MIISLSTLFAPSSKERLTEAVKLRTSCRSYRGAPAIADFSALSYYTSRYALPGARLALLPVDDSFFTGTLLGMKRITGCRMVAAVIISGDEPRARIHAGILGEAFVLEATSLGLGTCWNTGTYRRKNLQTALSANEMVLCVIAVGIPAAPLTAPRTRHRKPPEHFCRGQWREWPEQLLTAAVLVQQAPSAMNMQPWTLYVGAEGAFVVDANERAQLDVGIALCHAELALTIPHTWHFGTERGDPLAWAKVK
ncbi:MAG: nitroreductase family protein [Clostridia bacterium]|nr:nitroreductase family protein [Clostridia bacterium]